jgi:hypothetical protein
LVVRGVDQVISIRDRQLSFEGSCQDLFKLYRLYLRRNVQLNKIAGSDLI